MNLDTGLNINGDFDTGADGKIYRISGEEETRQKLYILLSARAGKFIYDRELGSGIFGADIQNADCTERIEAQARKALDKTAGAEVVGVVVDNGTVYVSVELDGKVYDIELRL